MENNAVLFVLRKQAAHCSVGVFCPLSLKKLFDDGFFLQRSPDKRRKAFLFKGESLFKFMTEEREESCCASL